MLQRVNCYQEWGALSRALIASIPRGQALLCYRSEVCFLLGVSRLTGEKRLRKDTKAWKDSMAVVLETCIAFTW